MGQYKYAGQFSRSYIPVFFLPKHCTLCVDAMIGIYACVSQDFLDPEVDAAAEFSVWVVSFFA